MKRISIWSRPGGSGRSTIALNLAAALAAGGARVLLVDSDPQSAALLWARLASNANRPTAFVVTAGLPRRQDDYDFILFDHAAGARKAAPPGELVVIPTLTDAASVLTLNEVRSDLKRQGKRTLVVANRWRKDRREHHHVLGLLGDVPVLRDRAVFATAYGRGATIYDADAGLLHTGNARAEMDELRSRVVRAGEGR